MSPARSILPVCPWLVGLEQGPYWPYVAPSTGHHYLIALLGCLCVTGCNLRSKKLYWFTVALLNTSKPRPKALLILEMTLLMHEISRLGFLTRLLSPVWIPWVTLGDQLLSYLPLPLSLFYFTFPFTQVHPVLPQLPLCKECGGS